jgi:hypothetical protein
MRVDDPQETLGASERNLRRATRNLSWTSRPAGPFGALHFCKRRSIFRGLGAKNCTFFRRRRLSGPGGEELKAPRKESKAKHEYIKTENGG